MKKFKQKETPNKSINCVFRINAEEQKELLALCEQTGWKKSRLIRHLLFKPTTPIVVITKEQQQLITKVIQTGNLLNNLVPKYHYHQVSHVELDLLIRDIATIIQQYNRTLKTTVSYDNQN
ncbi:MAG: hypothetical protein C0459_11790 [Chitinophaga sp.]|jgi:hypothetical protein|nr:hypothetical protein [Chitinophaga sp.]